MVEVWECDLKDPTLWLKCGVTFMILHLMGVECVDAVEAEAQLLRHPAPQSPEILAAASTVGCGRDHLG